MMSSMWWQYFFLIWTTTNGLKFKLFHTEWGRAVSVVSIRLENGLSPDRRQAISQTIADLFRVEPPGIFSLKLLSIT